MSAFWEEQGVSMENELEEGEAKDEETHKKAI